MSGFTFGTGAAQQPAAGFGAPAPAATAGFGGFGGGFGAASGVGGFGAPAAPAFGAQATAPAAPAAQTGSFGQQLREAPEEIQKQVRDANGQLADNAQRIQAAQAVLGQIPLQQAQLFRQVSDLEGRLARLFVAQQALSVEVHAAGLRHARQSKLINQPNHEYSAEQVQQFTEEVAEHQLEALRGLTGADTRALAGPWNAAGVLEAQVDLVRRLEAVV